MIKKNEWHPSLKVNPETEKVLENDDIYSDLSPVYAHVSSCDVVTLSRHQISMHEPHSYFEHFYVYLRYEFHVVMSATIST